MPETIRSISTGARSGVFISYARTDGEDFTMRLRAHLEKEGIPLWQDRVKMEGGRDWWLQITEALEHVEFMVLVMTPSALLSDIVRKEWRYARQQGVCVYPIIGSSSIDFSSLPRWMRDTHFYNIGSLEDGQAWPEWAKFLNDLRTRCHARRVPFMVEDLPEDFVERPAEFEQIISLLLDPQREEPVAITAALRGAGGFGKTTLARALCHDDRVQEAFDDGILWVTLGQEPGALTGHLEDLIYTLSGERPGFTGMDAATAYFVELLADRDILIVIDDVWNEAHLRPFLQGGPRCARLITTRNADTLPSTSKPVNVDAMQQNEAVELLRAGLPAGGEDKLRKLAKSLGEWPLLLKLVNGALRDRVGNAKQPLPDALSYVDKALNKRGLTFFDARNPVAREQAVKSTLSVSLDLLTDEERKFYSELAVFPEDVDIPLGTIGKLWGKTGGLDEFDVETFCDRLSRLSLLLRFDLTTRLVRLHDVIRAYLIYEQGTNLPALNQQLLDAHRPIPPSSGAAASPTTWADMRYDEPYLWEYLAYHLMAAGHGDELLSTVKDLRYLAAKSFVLDSLAVENDLLAARSYDSKDAVLRLLQRLYAQSGHILNRCLYLDDLKATLYSRLYGIKEMSPTIRRFASTLSPPYLAPWHPLPDQPHPALIRTISLGSGVVLCCALSPDGSYVLTGYSNVLELWDVKSGLLLSTLSGHRREVQCCDISRDGSTIVSGSLDDTLKVWDVRSGVERLTLAGHRARVVDCAISPDGSFIVSASWDGTVKVWDAKSGAIRHTLTEHKGWVECCAVSPDGSFIVSGAHDCELIVWDARSGERRFTLTGHTGRVTCCAVSPDNSFIVSGSEDCSLSVWDTQSGEELITLFGHTAIVTDCDISSDGSIIISSSWDRTVRAWDSLSGEELLTFFGVTGGIVDCAISPDSSFIASATAHGAVKIWDTLGETGIPGRSETTGWGRCCAVSSDGSFVITVSDDELLRLWNPRSGKVIRSLAGFRMNCALTPDDRFIVAMAVDGALKLIDINSGKELATYIGPGRLKRCCAISPDGSLVISSDDKVLKIFDAKSAAELRQLPGHDKWVEDCTFSPDGKFIVSSSFDGSIKVWDTETGIERFTLLGHRYSVGRCDVSPCGRLIASASSDGTLRVWDSESGKALWTLKEHTYIVQGCAFSPDGSLILSASLDNSLRLWDVATGMWMTTLETDGPMSYCAWLPDGQHIVATGEGGVYFLRLIR
jgi:WD40 repeat protein